jgi:predicted PurR-regulated permease PerM
MQKPLGAFVVIELFSIPCHNKYMSEQKLEGYFFGVVFIAILTLVGYIFYPFLGALTLALVLSILSTPFYHSVQRHITGKPSVAAGLVVLVVMLAVILPAIGLLILLIDEAYSLANYATSLDYNFLPRFVENVDTRMHTLFPTINSLKDSIDLGSILQKSTQYIGSLATNAVTGTLGVVFKLFLVIIALFFFLRDGKAFVDTLIKLSPLADDEDVRIVERIRGVTRSLVRGTLVIALLQGMMTGIGFALFGVPNPVLWGSVAAIGALVPNIGTSIVAIPAITYLAFSGGSPAAVIGLTAWSLLIVGLVDNIIGPKLIGSGAQIHPLFILLSVLGGLATFGIAGFLLGPLVFGILVALAEIYKVKISRLHEATQSL